MHRTHPLFNWWTSWAAVQSPGAVVLTMQPAVLGAAHGCPVPLGSDVARMTSKRPCWSLNICQAVVCLVALRSWPAQGTNPCFCQVLCISAMPGQSASINNPGHDICIVAWQRHQQGAGLQVNTNVACIKVNVSFAGHTNDNLPAQSVWVSGFWPEARPCT